jgi:hypothetical protein
MLIDSPPKIYRDMKMVEKIVFGKSFEVAGWGAGRMGIRTQPPTQPVGDRY